MIKKALLKDNDGNIISVFTMKKDHDTEHSITGELEEVVSWEVSGEIYEKLLFAELYVKWDGCSHFWFNGQDSKNEENLDSYYHICGIGGYLKFIRMLLFAYEVMVNHVGFDNIDEKEEFEELLESGMLDGYTIEYIRDEGDTNAETNKSN